MEASLFLGLYQDEKRVEQQLIPFRRGSCTIHLAGAEILSELSVRAGARPGVYFFNLQLFVTAGKTSRPMSAGVHFQMGRWSPNHYVLMPAAAYAGNRFRVAKSWKVEECDDIGPDMPITITQVPRLEAGDGPSRIELLTGDFSTPGVGFRDARTRRGFFLLTNQGNQLGNHSLSLEESADRTSAELSLKSPGIREGQRNGRASTDRGTILVAGQTIQMEFGLYFFDAPEIQALFDTFFAIRNDFRGQATLRHDIPFSSCWDIQQAKYNAQNWVEDRGYYSVGMRECAAQDWQTGWVGGTNAIYPLLCEGDGLTRQRAGRVIDFLQDGGVGDSGYFCSLFHEGKWHDRSMTLTRYQADSLYFIARSCLLQARVGPGGRAPDHWLALARGCADAFCDTWKRHGQFGQRVNTRTGEIMMGETCCAGLAPGGLAICSQLFAEPRYLEVAEEAAARYHRKFVRAGITNGGPGDIIQCPDSESAFGLLEAFMVLFEATGNHCYVEWARHVAHQCASWVVTYDYRFPPDSTFGKLNMLTTGTVVANVQNKHSAPGICTLSGISLLKLFRATTDPRYLDLIREIAHAIPQYMSRADRPICDRRPNQRWPVMDQGWINERINMSDWEVRGDPDNEIGVGEIFGGSTWSEVSMMLTFAELPGIYVQPDTGVLSVFDHVEARLDCSVHGRLALIVKNPTAFHASVKILSEESGDLNRPLGPLAGSDWLRIEVPPGETCRHELAGHAVGALAGQLRIAP